MASDGNKQNAASNASQGNKSGMVNLDLALTFDTSATSGLENVGNIGAANINIPDRILPKKQDNMNMVMLGGLALLSLLVVTRLK